MFQGPKNTFCFFILLDINEVEQKKPLLITLLYLYRKQKKWKQKFPPDPCDEIKKWCSFFIIFYFVSFTVFCFFYFFCFFCFLLFLLFCFFIFASAMWLLCRDMIKNLQETLTLTLHCLRREEEEAKIK